MKGSSLLKTARKARGLTQVAAARRAGTSQATLSAYERGTKSPTLAVAERILEALGYDLALQPRVTFTEHRDTEGRSFLVPDQLWRLDPRACFKPLMATTRADSRHLYMVINREERKAAYLWLIQHGDESLLIERLDGGLLIDAWPEIEAHLPEPIRASWNRLVETTIEGWFIDAFRDDPRIGHRRKPVSRAARIRALRRLIDYGLTEDQILRVLERRPGV